MEPHEVSYELVERVREVVARHTRRTPLLRSEWLSDLTGATVFLKCENLQLTGSFKLRGALAALALLADEARPPGVVASSAGNHGLGLARAGRIFGVPVTIVVPRSVPAVKAAGIEALGARVVRAPHESYDATQAWTLENLAQLGGTFVSPYEDPGVIAGNGGTLMCEILEDLDAVDAVVIPCGGGGCAIGAGLVARARRPATRILGVNTSASPGMWLSRRDGKPYLQVDSLPTIAEGIEGGVGEFSFALAEEYVHRILLVHEATIRRAVGEIAARERLLVEGSGAAGVAALLEKQVTAGRICVVLTGSNIDAARLLELLG